MRARLNNSGRCRRGFTLAEMLVVLVIIGLLAALVLPHIRGHSESVAINAACRQLVDDLSFARQRAMSQRSTVAVVFISADIFNLNLASTDYTTNEVATIKRLQGGVYTYYALYQYRKVGEQPGSYVSAGYITEWKSLPDKTFIDPTDYPDLNFFHNGAKFPFPNSTSIKSGDLPYLAFDSEGRSTVVDRDETGAGRVIVRDFNLHVAVGQIFYSRRADGSVDSTTYDVQQVPPTNSINNIVHIDYLTGRAQRLEPQLQ